ncbi:MAG: outer membrane protein assembly factor BamA [Gemmatimonadetes bacterium]|nr:MAG: outer membrane protein assembly factor BamA [Gemmatimonadota bacterium]
MQGTLRLEGVIRRLTLPIILSLAAVAPGLCVAQAGAPGATQTSPPAPDSIAVVGNRRNSAVTVIQISGLVPGRALNYRDVQRAIQALYTSGQFDDVAMTQSRTQGGKNVLVIRVHERPQLVKWAMRGVQRLPEHSVRDKVTLVEGRPLDLASVERSRARIDSLYHARGYYLEHAKPLFVYERDSSAVRVIFDIDEGRRVAIAQVDIQGNTHFTDEEITAQMKSRPEGFWWFRSGEYNDDKIAEDLRQTLPAFYGKQGYVDFQVLDDTLVVSEQTGKATLVVRVSEGEPYRIGSFEIVGNRRFSTEELQTFYPFAGEQRTGLLGLGGRHHLDYFDDQMWQDATRKLQTLYYNNGYIYVNVRNDEIRRTAPDGNPVVDLRWVITEGQPAIVNHIEIRGNDVTHDRVIREAIVMVPGDVFRQDALIASYQRVSNLGFFNQPMPFPDTKPANDQGDIDVIFRVTEKRTGNINFGASVGQGTGVGGFLGLDEPNLFGQGKRGRFQWQFGKNINDFDVSFTDPAVHESRVSATVDLHNQRVRYVIADVGRLRRRGASLQLGFPFFGDNYTRLYLSYGIDQQSFTGSSTNAAFTSAFRCNDCVRSTVGASLMRDTRIDMPFPTAGTMVQFGLSQSGGILGGSGNFQRVDAEGHFYAPIGSLGSPGSSQVKFVLGFSTRSGFVFGSSPFFEQLFTLGGTQFFIPLRGYDEASITPFGYDPNAANNGASPNAFGKAFFSMTGELGMRVSQMLYLSAFFDAGNVWSRPAQYDPTRLFRGAGIGAAVISPLGPLGIDYAYGFDKVDPFGRPAGSWKLHFKLGNFF